MMSLAGCRLANAARRALNAGRHADVGALKSAASCARQADQAAVKITDPSRRCRAYNVITAHDGALALTRSGTTGSQH